MIVLLAAGFLAAAMPASAEHDGIAWSGLRYASLTDDDDFFGTALVAPDGSLYVFYQRRENIFGTTNIWMTKFQTGGPTGFPQPVGSLRVNDVNGVAGASSDAIPRATIDHNGHLYVAWVRALATGGNRLEVYVSKSEDAGASWLPAVRANAPTGVGNDFRPAITTTPDGRIWVAWVQEWSGFFNITRSYSANGGQTFVGYANVSGQGAESSPVWTDIAADAQGRLHLAYWAIENAPFAYVVNYTRSDDGVAWTAPVPISGVAWAAIPSLAVDAQGRLHVSWVDFRMTPNGSLSMWYRRSDDRGASWGPEARVSQGAGFLSTGISDLVTSGDTVMVAWDTTTAGGGLGFAVSADGGDTWAPEAGARFEVPVQHPALAADRNGTVYAALTDVGGANENLGIAFWEGPPSRPTITSVARSPGTLTVSWTASPEADVALYRLWRSADGSTYELVATVPATTTTYADGGLANGTYWYKVTAVDAYSISSHPSSPASGTVGLTTEERLAALQAQIDALAAALAAAQLDIDALQAALAQAQADLDALQAELGSARSDLAAMQGQLDDLEAQLNAVRTEQATQSMSYITLVLLILVIVLLVVLILRTGRRPTEHLWAPEPPAAPREGPPSPPSPPEPRDVDEL